jgi:LPS-assembly lipoprotein
LLLTSCGFHLRGAVTLPPQMERTQLLGVDARDPLAEEITAALEDAGVRVVAGDATAQLIVSGERQARRLLSVGSTGRASEYEISYQFSFELRAPAAEATDAGAKPAAVVLVPQQGVSLDRDYSFDPDNVLGKGDEEALLVREMRSFAVRQMLVRLRAGLQQAKP